jgi:hypothetical protein
MSSACTLICPSDDRVAALDAIETHRKATRISGSRSKWTSARFKSPGGTLTFNCLLRVKPGDEFSGLVLGFHNHFNQISTKAKANKQFVLDRILDAGMMIGVVGDPEFIEADGHFDTIWSASEKLDALVFTGSAMLNGKGETLLDEDGTFEIKVAAKKSTAKQAAAKQAAVKKTTAKKKAAKKSAVKTGSANKKAPTKRAKARAGRRG